MQETIANFIIILRVRSRLIGLTDGPNAIGKLVQRTSFAINLHFFVRCKFNASSLLMYNYRLVTTPFLKKKLHICEWISFQNRFQSLYKVFLLHFDDCKHVRTTENVLKIFFSLENKKTSGSFKILICTSITSMRL